MFISWVNTTVLRLGGIFKHIYKHNNHGIFLVSSDVKLFSLPLAAQNVAILFPMIKYIIQQTGFNEVFAQIPGVCIPGCLCCRFVIKRNTSYEKYARNNFTMNSN